MIQVTSNSIAEAWRNTLRSLHVEGKELPEHDYYRALPAIIEVADSRLEHYDERFPLERSLLDAQNNFLVSGAENEGVSDEVRMHRDRLFAEEENQIEHIIFYLKKNPLGKGARATLWNQQSDMYAERGPSLQHFSLHMEDGALLMRAHLHLSDGYRTLLSQMSELATLQHYVAERIGVPCGECLYFVDLLHIYNEDQKIVDELILSF